MEAGTRTGNANQKKKNRKVQNVVDAAARRKLLSVELRKRPKKSKIIEKK